MSDSSQSVHPEGEPAAATDAATSGPPHAEAPTHHEPLSTAFSRFMADGWEEPTGSPVRRDEVAPHTAARRSALSTHFIGKHLVVPTGGLKVRANDTDYPFRPGTDFYWLTGCDEPDAVLVMTAIGDGHDATVYLAGRSDRSTPAFYRDARYGELWVGPRRGVAETQVALDVHCRDITELDATLESLDPSSTLVRRGFDDHVESSFPPNDERSGDDRSAADQEGDGAQPPDDTSLAAVLSELRLIKDDYEVARLEEAVAATVAGFEECVRELSTATSLERGERWIEGTFFRRARLDGNDVGYGSIVACGHHATTLHWVRNDGPVVPDQLALLDMGVESRALYTADVTRTLPIGGRFTTAQRQVYDVVAAAQQAGVEAVAPGAAYLAPHRAAMGVIVEALRDWGLVHGEIDDLLSEDPQNPSAGLYRRYTLHATSHMLGLDVHDCAEARNDLYRDGVLQVGMVLTVEPGLYFQRDDLTVPEELRGIGVRIEDDILVTADGHRNLSAALPRQADDVEAWMAALRH